LTVRGRTLYHCYNVRTTIHRIGNSQGVLIPKPLLAQVGLGREVEMSVERDAIVLRKPRPGVREGWGQASQALAAAGDEELAWPEFANAGDADLTW
jgi:antitoxin MazE